MLKVQTSHGGSLNYKSGAGKSLPDGITHKESHFAQTIADNLDAVEETIAEAKEKDRIPTSWDVLKNVHKKKQKEPSAEPLKTIGKYFNY